MDEAPVDAEMGAGGHRGSDFMALAQKNTENDVVVYDIFRNFAVDEIQSMNQL